MDKYYCEDNGRPAADPVMLVKMVLLQHLYGIRSLRQTVKEIEVNVVYRWFLGMGIDTAVPHFATVSYAFATRFPGELCEKIFAWVLETAVAKKYVRAETIFIDGTHIKASANKNKKRKELAAATARVYNEQLREEINADRETHGKKPLKDKPDETPLEKEITVSTTDPDCGVFRKSNTKICENCPHRAKCTESKSFQKVVTRHIWEEYIEPADDFRYTPEGIRSYVKRKETIERVFADAKEKHAMRYTHIRGLTRVKSWVGLKLAAMNLKKLAAWAAKQPIHLRVLRAFCHFCSVNPLPAT